MTLISLVLSWISKIPLWFWVSLTLLFAGWQYGNYRAGQVQQEWDASVERGKAAVAELKKKQVLVNTVVETKYVPKIEIVKEAGRVIEKEIPVYIPQYRDLLPGGFRLLHDAAATSTIPSSTELPFAAAVTVGEVTSTVSSNYTQCNEWREQVLGWQEWYGRTASEWNLKQKETRH